MAVDDDRRATAAARRSNIISAMSRELDPHQDGSAAQRLRSLIEGPPRKLIVSADIDGLVSAAMLSQVTGWDALALVVKSDKVYLHPDAADRISTEDMFGVDVFSTLFPSVSNHVALWGSPAVGAEPWGGRGLIGGGAEATAAARAYDDVILQRSRVVLMANPSLMAGIAGSYPGDAKRPKSATYRYPLGTAQFLLALLEAAGYPPRLFDREYLPWLIANCDGGVDSFEKYHYNVPMWWSCMAAAVGPASLSEHVYQVVRNQRPNEFRDVVNRLRSEDAVTAQHLSEDWNLKTQGLNDIAPVLSWITAISGWRDPVLGGAETLDAWSYVQPEGRILDIARLPAAEGSRSALEMFRWHLRNSLEAVHTNFAFFNPDRIGWMKPWDTLETSTLDLPEALHKGPTALTLPEGLTVELGDGLHEALQPDPSDGGAAGGQ